jgi:hypothetical protein
MAIACLRLLTRPPLPPGPLRRVPRFRRRIALETLRLAASPYFRPPDERRRDDFRVAMIRTSWVSREYPTWGTTTTGGIRTPLFRSAG